jgi:hypothetical protein
MSTASSVLIDPNDVLVHPSNWVAISNHAAHLYSVQHPVVAVYTIHGQQQAVLVGAGWASERACSYLDAPGTKFYKKTFQACNAQFPENPSAALLSRLIAGEATISLDSIDEMAAVAYSAVNRVNYLAKNPNTKPSFFGATDRTLAGVINPDQYGSVGSPMWNQAANPGTVNILAYGGSRKCSFLSNAFSVANGVVSGSILDPFDAFGGTYGMRTAGHGPPGGAYVEFPASAQIKGSGNVFFGLE